MITADDLNVHFLKFQAEFKKFPTGNVEIFFKVNIAGSIRSLVNKWTFNVLRKESLI